MHLFLPLPGTRNRCPALAAIGWRGCAGDVTVTGAQMELKVGIGERKESCFLVWRAENTSIFIIKILMIMCINNVNLIL